MSAQRQRAKASRHFANGRTVREEDFDLGSTCFTGYHGLSQKTLITHIMVDGELADSATGGQKASIVLKDTPFYAEKGGQVGDTGIIEGSGVRFDVTDTICGPGGSTIHHGTVSEGTLRTGDAVTAHVNECRRADIARNHTATHLLHISLRKTIGSHAEQKGSLVSPDRLRFDFSHLKPLSPQELEQVETMVNESIRANLPVNAREMSFKQALESGAIAIFDEKYGENVRVLTVGTRRSQPNYAAVPMSGNRRNRPFPYHKRIINRSRDCAELKLTGRAAEELLRANTRLIRRILGQN